jgi:peptide/nickel transport system permease protein
MRFVLRRLGFFVLTLWAALTLNFFLPRLMPGNPALAAIGNHRGSLTPDALKVLEHQNILSQYVSYLGNVATGKFGSSLTTQPGTSVGRIVLDAIPWTLGLVGLTTVLAFVLGTGIGIVGAWRRGGRLDSIMPPIFVIMTVIPYFWIGLILILVFGVKLHWLPYFFTYDVTLTPGFNLSFIGNVLKHAILPAFTLLITTIGTWILTMRNTMITTLAEDYVRMARAKGLPGRRIMLDYAARNAILPNLTGFAMSLGFVVGGAILIEEVFNYAGIGFLLLQAVNNNDYPLEQALFLLITAAVLVAILISDIATAALDPRTRGAR